MTITVPNQWPTKLAARRIAVVAEAPANTEVAWHVCPACKRGWDPNKTYSYKCPDCGKVGVHTPTPLVGPSGWLLNQLLAEVGIDRAACWVGNVCQVQAPGNDITHFKWDGPEIQAGLKQLWTDLSQFKPHFCLLLGGSALRAFKGHKCSIESFRGSLFVATVSPPDCGASLSDVHSTSSGHALGQAALSCETATANGAVAESASVLAEHENGKQDDPASAATFQVKCLATFHPAALQRDYSLTAVVRFDVAKAAREVRTDELVLPTRNIEIGLSKQELLARLAELRSRKLLTALDIEGGCGNIACIGFATSASSAFVVPFANVDGTSVWEEADEIELWEGVAGVLEDPSVPKVIMNALYELFVLAWTLGIVIRGLQDDIMLGHWELYCELEKALEFQASIYTNQPYWKLHHKKVRGRYLPFHPDGRLATSEEWYTYNGIDCCVTFECATVIASRLAKAPGSLRHYRFNMQLLMPILYMQLRGIRYDKEAAKAKLKRVERWIGVLQDMLNRAACGHRDELKTLYDGLASGVVGQGAKLDNGVAPEEKEVGVVAPIVHLIRTHLCLAKPRRKRTVQLWQPMRWNGKKWVKAGKRLELGECESGPKEKPETPQRDDLYYRECDAKEVSESAEIQTLADCVEFAKESCKDDVRRICRLLERGCRHGGDRSALAEALNVHVKVNSTGNGGDACWFLYDVCGFEKQYQKEGNRKTDRLASDDEALIKIWVQEQKKPQAWQHSGVKVKNRGRLALAFLKLRRLVTATKTLSTNIDADGRMRCAYNVVGTETGRLTCYESPTGSGYNLQTTTKPQRHLFLADEGCLLSQCDLAGADGWTVAAYAAAQGDRTMLEDYRAGIKPAKVGVLMWKQGPAVNKLDRAALKQACKSVDGDSWEYFGFKRVQHGCYTGDHEVLTPLGWVNIVDYVKGNSVPLLVYDNQTRRAWFEHPVEKQELLYSGKLFTFQGSSVDFTVTAEHKIPFITNDNPKVMTAAELFQRGSGTRVPTACEFVGGYLQVTHARLVAAFQADGHRCEGGWVTFHFKKQRKVDRLKMLLTQANIPFTCGHCKNGTQHFYIPKKGADNFTAFGKAASEQMLDWCQESLRDYLDEHRYWDGSISEGVKCNLSAKDLSHIQWLDTLLHLTLQNGTFQKPQISGFGTLMHKLNYNRRTLAERSSMTVFDETVKQHPVYCVTTSTGFIMVRRRGKIVASGNSSYAMGKGTMSDQILTDSWKLTGKPVFVPPAVCEQMQRTCFFARYWGIQRWHQWMEQEVRSRGSLTASNGFTRRFFGRKDDHATVKAALAHLPQVYTTGSTMMAMLKQWSDPDNRREDGSLKCEILHTVHDSLLSQFPSELRDWVIAKQREWFANPVQVAGEVLTIPYECGVGPDWKHVEPV